MKQPYSREGNRITVAEIPLLGEVRSEVNRNLNFILATT